MKTPDPEPKRDAIDERLEQLRNDDDFQANLRDALERNREALELLAK